MTDERSLMQGLLDDALLESGIPSFYGRRIGDAEEYIVYSVSNESFSTWADDTPIRRTVAMTLIYYYPLRKAETGTGRAAVLHVENLVKEALRQRSIHVVSFDGGDIGDTGSGTIVFEAVYEEVL